MFSVQDKFGAQPTSVASATFSASNTRDAKVCAKLSSGVRFGIGFVLERACGPECTTCTGKSFDRKCRLYTFRPHYDVRLETKVSVPEAKVRQLFNTVDSVLLTVFSPRQIPTMGSGLTSFTCLYPLSLLYTLENTLAHEQAAFTYLQRFSSNSGLGIGYSTTRSHCPSGKDPTTLGNDLSLPNSGNTWRPSSTDLLSRNSFCRMCTWITQVMHGPMASLLSSGSKLLLTGSKLTCIRETKKVPVRQMKGPR